MNVKYELLCLYALKPRPSVFLGLEYFEMSLLSEFLNKAVDGKLSVIGEGLTKGPVVKLLGAGLINFLSKDVVLQPWHPGSTVVVELTLKGHWVLWNCEKLLNKKGIPC